MKLMLDFDSTVFRLLDAMALVPGGERVRYEDCPTWLGLADLCGPADEPLTVDERVGIMLGIFSEAMRVETMQALGERAIYEGATEQLQRLRASGVQIHLVTDRPQDRITGTADFAHQQGIPFDAIHRVSGRDKTQWCIDNGVHVMVDDHPDTISQAVQAGITALTLDHLYNREVVAEHGISSHADWSDLGPAVEAALCDRY